MALASDRIDPAHVSALRHVKELRERRALADWHAMDAQRRLAAQAEAEAGEDLRKTHERRAAREREIYSRLIESGTTASGELERCRMILEALASEVERKRKRLEETKAAHGTAEAAATASRAVWARSSVSVRKWGLIETDLGTLRRTRQDFRTEIEAEDDIALRRVGSRAAADGGKG
jgi:hypothetical protein